MSAEINGNDEQIVLRFPNDFLRERPVRPPHLPGGSYEVTWLVSERSKRLTIKRRIRGQFVAEDRARWERVHHEYLPQDEGSVRLLWDGAAPFGLRVKVRHLASRTDYSMRMGSGFEVDGGLAVIFPDGFDVPSPPAAGRYEVEWSEMPQSWMGEEGPEPDPIVAHEFSFPGGDGEVE